jgi:hypothetical protein
MAKKKTAHFLPKLSHIQDGCQLETDSLGGNPVLRRLKDSEGIRPLSANRNTIKAMEERGLISPGKGRDPLTILWRLKKKIKSNSAIPAFRQKHLPRSRNEGLPTRDFDFRAPTGRHHLFLSASGVRFSICPVTSEGMDCPCSRHHLATVRHTARNQILLASFDRNAPSINQQCVTALHNQHVLIKFMDMLCGSCSLSASPKRHLAFVGSVKHVSFDTGRCLI